MKIIHARCSETGSANGKKGDQANEVAITDFYNHKLGWYFLNAYDPKLSITMIKYAVKLANNKNVGYGQNDRLSLLDQLKKHNFNVDQIEPCNCDCSSFIRVLIILACRELGINCEKITNFTTANEKYVLLNSGLFYLTTYKTNGTIAVTKSKGHTVIIYDTDNSLYLDTPNKSIEEIARLVIAGKYGNGEARRAKIESEGYNYKEVQNVVNKILKG